MARPSLSVLVSWLRKHGIRLAGVLGLGTALTVAGCAQLVQKEREMTFRVAAGTASWYGGLPEGVIESTLLVDAGKGKTERVHTWWLPAEDPKAPALLYLHGSRWNLTGQAFRIEQLRDFGFSVLAIDYRGFGQSDGDLPSEETVYQDARAAWERLTALQPDPNRRFIYGHSLGGAVAIDLAAELSRTADAKAAQSPQTAQSTASAHPARGLIVESSFTTLADVARALSYSWLPVQWFLSQKFDSIDKIARVSMPVLIVHGTRDRYIPARFSETLYQAASGKKRLVLVEGGTHNNSMRIGRSDYLDAMRELFGWAPPAT